MRVFLAGATGVIGRELTPLLVLLGRLGGGVAGVSAMTEQRGASNAKAKRELGWGPEHPSWRDGFRAALS